MTRSRAGRAPRRFLASALIASLAVSLVAAPVAAVDPGDEPSTAVPIATSDFGTPQDYDTSASTESPDDPTSCESAESGLFEGPFTETFWHAFTPDVSGELLVDVNSFPDPEAPGYLAILFVFADDGAGGLTPVGCNAFPATVLFEAEAGVTYYAMTGSLADLAGGGPTQITIAEPFLSGVTLNPTGTIDPQTGIVTISGSVTCEGAADFIDVFVDAGQTVGSHLVLGGGGSGIEGCGGEVEWAVELEGFTSFFNPGRLEVGVNVFACGQVCLGDFLSGEVRVRPIDNRPVPPEPPPPPPANDERAAALPIGIGEFIGEDLSAATANATDPQDCDGSGPSSATLWYTFTPEADVETRVLAFPESHDLVVHVLDGDTVVGCGVGGGGLVVFEAVAGTTYDIMIGAINTDAPGFFEVGLVEVVDDPDPGDPPPNDEAEDAIPLVVGGPELTADTSAATVNLDTDPQECPFAGFPPSNHSVWYAITAESDGFIEVNTLDSDYDTTLYVLDEGGEVIACNDDTVGVASQVVFEATAGSTYQVMSGTFADSAGGNLVIRAVVGEAPFALDVTIDEVGTVDPRTGIATVTGTATCSEPAGGFLSVFANQQNGRFEAIGDGGLDLACGPDGAAWSVQVFPLTSKFQTGALSVFVETFVETEDGESDFQFLEAIVQLKPAK